MVSPVKNSAIEAVAPHPCGARAFKGWSSEGRLGLIHSTRLLSTDNSLAVTDVISRAKISPWRPSERFNTVVMGQQPRCHRRDKPRQDITLAPCRGPTPLSWDNSLCHTKDGAAPPCRGPTPLSGDNSLCHAEDGAAQPCRGSILPPTGGDLWGCRWPSYAARRMAPRRPLEAQYCHLPVATSEAAAGRRTPRGEWRRAAPPEAQYCHLSVTTSEAAAGRCTPRGEPPSHSGWREMDTNNMVSSNVSMEKTNNMVYSNVNMEKTIHFNSIKTMIDARLRLNDVVSVSVLNSK